MVSSASLCSTGSDSDTDAEFHFFYATDGTRTVHRCHCDAKLKIQRDWELENLGRRFVRCPYRQEFNCGYFEWIDPVFPTEATTIIMDLLDSKSTLEQHRTELIQSINAKDEKIATLEAQFEEAKGFAEWLSEVDEGHQKQLEVVEHEKKRLFLQMKRQNLLTALVMGIVAAAIWFLN